MDYVYCGNEAGGRPDEIITLTSKFHISDEKNHEFIDYLELFSAIFSV